jgi:hypothetical protein
VTVLTEWTHRFARHARADHRGRTGSYRSAGDRADPAGEGLLATEIGALGLGAAAVTTPLTFLVMAVATGPG